MNKKIMTITPVSYTHLRHDKIKCFPINELKPGSFGAHHSTYLPLLALAPGGVYKV